MKKDTNNSIKPVNFAIYIVISFVTIVASYSLLNYAIRFNNLPFGRFIVAAFFASFVGIYVSNKIMELLKIRIR